MTGVPATIRREAGFIAGLMLTALATAFQADNSGNSDQDHMLLAVAKLGLRANPKLTCVIFLPRGWVTDAPMEPVSERLLKQLLRFRSDLANANESTCVGPVLWLGPVRWIRASKEAVVYVGEPLAPTIGQAS